MLTCMLFVLLMRLYRAARAGVDIAKMLECISSSSSSRILPITNDHSTNWNIRTSSGARTWRGL